ncbi:hypothetical protein GUY61_32705 [Streptomyces sp. GC420]|nr:hypothetical protein [Streptomyces sp. GC420]
MRTPLISVLALGLLGGLGAGTAHATGYRYWSFWDRVDGSWTYATQGPATAVPADGDVQGFRFSVSEDSQDAAKPRGAADFAAICADTPAEDGSKRVALVIDFGTPQDAPEGEAPPERRTACARVDEDASSAQALASVAEPLRYNRDALLCAIAGYPESGCGEQVSAGDGGKGGSAGNGGNGGKDHDGNRAGASRKRDGDDGGPSVGVVAGIAAVVLLGAAGAWQTRRRRG